MRVLVVTVVHHPLDARIHSRQIAALRAAGHDVTYLAPWSDHDVSPSEVHPGVTTMDVPRASGRARARAWRAARRLIAQLGDRHDVILLHDPELVLAVAGVRRLRGQLVVLDVHEDTAAALVDKPWLPGGARRVVAAAVSRAERWAEGHLRLLLAEERYAERLPGGPEGVAHPIVPNSPMVPAQAPPGPEQPYRVVQVGRLSGPRGVEELLAVAAALHDEVEVHLIGPADRGVEAAVRAAHDAGMIVWHGFVPNDEALGHVDGALVGLALLHDTPNYRVSMPTKVLEYLAHGVPVITTALPLGAHLVEAADAGTVVGFGDVAAVVEAVRALLADPAQARAAGLRGHDFVAANHAWNVDGPRFVDQLQRWAHKQPLGGR